MSRLEFERWRAFSREAPFDDLHRYHRPAALIARSMSGADFSDLIKVLIDKPEAQISDEMRNTLAALGVTEIPENYKDPSWQQEAL